MKSKVLRSSLTLVILPFLMLSGACGLKGDLYIPEKEASAATPVAEPDDASEVESQSEEKQIAD